MNHKTSVSALQELMAAKKLHLPQYIEEGFSPRFKCTVLAGGITKVGYSTTKKGAKHECAKAALQILQKQSLLQIQEAPTVNPVLKNYVGQLNEYAQKHRVHAATYELVTISQAGDFYHKCHFVGKSTIGSASNKKDAKQVAAMKMLEVVDCTPSALEKYRLITNKSPTTFNINSSEIIRMYQNMSVNSTPKPAFSTYPPVPGIKICNTDTVEELQSKLMKQGIRYVLKTIQIHPYIVHVKIDDTDLHFLGSGNTNDEATKQVLQEVLEVKKSGCSLDTNDLISFI